MTVVKHEVLVRIVIIILMLLGMINIGFIVDYHFHTRTVNKACEALKYIRLNESYFYKPNGSYYAHVFIQDYKDAERLTKAFQKYRPLIAEDASCNEKRGVFEIFVKSKEYKEFVKEAGGIITWPIETSQKPLRPVLNKTGNMTYLSLEYDIHTPYDYNNFAISLIKANAIGLVVSLTLLLRKYRVRDILKI